MTQDDARPANLPKAIAEWMDHAGLPVPATETQATCDQCAMCSPDAPEGSALYFHPRMKCCLYEPELPNFIVGRILNDGSPEARAGRTSVEMRIGRRVGVGPWGLAMPRKYAPLYNNNSAALFGRSPELRCSHYGADDGQCTIWPYRNGVCSTWFCRFDRGELGKRYWEAIRELSMEIEWSLGVWCATELGAPATELVRLLRRATERLTPADLGGPGADDYASRWGNWLGREAEFYARAASMADALTWADMERIGGVRVSAQVGLARRAAEELTTRDLPARLKVGTFRVVEIGQGGCVVAVSSESMRVLDPVLRAVLHFDGRPTSEVLEEIQAQEGFVPTGKMLQRFVDFGLLKGVD